MANHNDDVLKIAGLRLRLEGASEFERELSAIRHELNVAGNEFKKLGQHTRNMGDTTEEFSQKLDRLREKQDAQRRKLEELRKVQQKYNETHDESSKGSRALTEEIQKEELAYLKIEGQILSTERAFQKFNTGQKQAGGEIREITKRYADSMEDARHEFKLMGLEMENVRKSSHGYETQIKSLNTQHEQQENKLQDLRKAYKDYTEQYGESSEASRTLKREIQAEEIALKEIEGQLKTTQEAYDKFKKSPESVRDEIRQVSAAFADHKEKLAELGKEWEKQGEKIAKTGKKISSAGKDISKVLTLPTLAVATKSIKDFVEYEDAFIGVKKTVEATNEQYEKLYDTFRRMSTELPFTSAEIAELAEIAGQMGIQAENIESFTKTLLDLGASTDVIGAEGAQQIAKFINLTGMAAEDYRRFGSSLVELGNKAETTEGQILKMAERIAGAGSVVGLRQDQILGLATALSSVGIKAEAGGTAVSNLLMTMQSMVDNGSDALDKLAGRIGMTGDEYRKLFEEDAAQALNLYLELLRDTRESGESVADVLDLLNIKNVRQKDAVLRLSNATHGLSTYLDIANQGWVENIALTEEANEAYSSAANRLKVSQNRIKDAGIEIGELITPIFADLVERLADTVHGFTELPEAVQLNILRFAGFAAVLGPVVGGIGKTVEAVGTLHSAFGKMFKALGDSKIGTSIASLKSLGGVEMTKVAGKVGLATAAISLLVVAIKRANEPSEQMRRNLEEIDKVLEQSAKTSETVSQKFEGNVKAAEPLIKRIRELEQVEELSVQQKIQMRIAVEQLNELFPELGLQIDSVTGKTNKSAESVNNFIEAEKRRLELKAAQDALTASVEAQMLAYQALDEAERNSAAYWEGVDQDSVGGFFKRVGGFFGADNHKDIESAQEKVKETTAILDQATAKYEDILNAQQEYEAQKARLQEESVKKTSKTLKAQQVEYAEFIRFYASLPLDFEEVATYWTSMTEAQHAQQVTLWDTFAGQLGMKTEDIEKLLNSHYESIEKEAQSNRQKMGSIADEGIAKMELTAEQMVANLRQQNEDWQEWRDDLTELVGKVPPDVLGYLEQLGPGARDILKQMNEWSEEEMMDFIDILDTRSKNATDAAINRFGVLPPDMQAVLAQAGLVVRNDGQIIVRNMKQLLASAANMDEGTLQAFRDLGINIMDGVASGITARQHVIADRTAMAVRRGLREGRAVALVQSPSKLFRDELGVYIAEGIAVGIHDKSSEVSKATGDLIKDAANTAANIPKIRMNFMEARVDEDIDDGIIAVRSMIDQQLEELRVAEQRAEEAGRRFAQAYNDGFVDQMRSLSALSLEATQAQMPTTSVAMQNGATQEAREERYVTEVRIESLAVRSDDDIRLLADEIERLSERRRIGNGISRSLTY